MKERVEQTPPSSPMKIEIQRLKKETNGLFAPTKAGFFAAKRQELVEEYVHKELEKFDSKENQDEQLQFAMEL